MFRTFPSNLEKIETRPGFVSLRSHLNNKLQKIWAGNDQSPAFRMEQRFVLIRWLGLIVIAPTLLLFDMKAEQLAAAYAVLLLAAVYNLQVQKMIDSKSEMLDSGYVTTIGDGFLSICIILIGGGFDTSFNYVLYTTTMAAAMRYGWGPSMVVIAVYFSLDAFMSLMGGGAGINGDFILRSLFLLLTVLLASYLQDQARIAEAALAHQLERARALNDSARALSSSLNIKTVMSAVAQETRKLMNAEETILGLAWNGDGQLSFEHASSRNTESIDPQRREILRTLVTESQQSLKDRIQAGTIADGSHFMTIPLNGRGSTSGYVGVLRKAAESAFTYPDQELLTSFMERAALAVENASLYKTIDDRSHDLTRAYADLAEAHQELLGIDEMKTSFIANVSHELRTPLTSIRSFSELLLSYPMDTETEKEFLGIINAESERLTRLINDVLDVTKIESGHMEWQIEPQNLNELLNISARSFSNLAVEQGLEFHIDLPEQATYVGADRDRILQVLANLLGNALKFTDSGSISLTTKVNKTEAHISVSDTGVGIPEEDRQLVFDKFHQVGDTLTNKPHGTGLGLSICRDIINYHGGQIWVESEVGKGSTFSFSLPLTSA